MEKIKVRLSPLDECSKSLIQRSGYSTTLDIVLSAKKTWKSIYSHLESKWNKIKENQSKLQVFILNGSEKRFTMNMMESSKLADKIGSSLLENHALPIPDESVDLVTYQCFYSFLAIPVDADTVSPDGYTSDNHKYLPVENTMDCFASLRDYANMLEGQSVANDKTINSNLSTNAAAITADENGSVHTRIEGIADAYSVLNELTNSDCNVPSASEVTGAVCSNDDVTSDQQKVAVSSQLLIASDTACVIPSISSSSSSRETDNTASASARGFPDRKSKHKKKRVTFKETGRSTPTSSAVDVPVVLPRVAISITDSDCNRNTSVNKHTGDSAPIANANTDAETQKLLCERASFPSSFYTSTGYISVHIKNYHRQAVPSGGRRKKRITPYYIGPLPTISSDATSTPK